MVREANIEQEEWEMDFEEKLWLHNNNQMRWKEESRRNKLFASALDDERLESLQQFEKTLSQANARMNRVRIETDEDGRRIFRRQESQPEQPEEMSSPPQTGDPLIDEY